MKETENEFRKTISIDSDSDQKPETGHADRCKVISINDIRNRTREARPSGASRIAENAVSSDFELKELDLKRTAMRSVIGTVQERELRSKQQRRQRKTQVYQRKLAICFAVLLILVNICGFMMTNAFADEAVSPALHPYYTSIRIEEGDSLWSIASRYSQKSPMNIGEYISELKRMNQLTSDTIHAGHYLTVVYYK